MKPRPTSITVVSWILMVSAGISLISSLLTMNNPMVKELMDKSPIPLEVQYIILYAGLGVTFVTGFYMLKGSKWARDLYVAWGLVGLVIGITTSPMKVAMIPSFVFFLVMLFFLFRPPARQFFNRETPQNDRPGV